MRITSENRLCKYVRASKFRIPKSNLSTLCFSNQVNIFPEKIKKLEGEIKDRENMMEEKEMVIAHLVNVVNRYAFNDRCIINDKPFLIVLTIE